MISRTLLLTGAAAAAGYLGWILTTYHGTLDERVALVFAVKLVLVLATGVCFLLLSGRPDSRTLERLAAFSERHTGALLALIIASSAAIAFLTTPQIDYGEGQLGRGYGNDGVFYGRMTEHFAWFKYTVPGWQFAYRPLAPMLVHYSGLDTFTGFRVLNLSSHALASLLVYRIGRHLHLPPVAALLAVGFLAILKFGLKFLVYYPVLTDGLGMLLLMTIIWATLEKRAWLYLLAMAAAVYTRENLLALTVFNALYLIRTGNGPRRFLTAAVLQLPPFAVYVLNRRHPVFLPLYDTGPWPMLASWGRRFLLDPGWREVSFLAYCNSLGALLILALLSWRGVARFLGEHYEWAYYVGANAVLSIVGGADVDRYAVWLAPVAIFALLSLDFSRPGPPPRIWLYWFALQAAAMEFFLPWFPDEAFSRSRCAAYATGTQLTYVTVFSWALIATVVAMQLGDQPDGTRPSPREGAATTALARSGSFFGPSKSAPAT